VRSIVTPPACGGPPRTLACRTGGGGAYIGGTTIEAGCDVLWFVEIVRVKWTEFYFGVERGVVDPEISAKWGHL
jgi:hypothetical protein